MSCDKCPMKDKNHGKISAGRGCKDNPEVAFVGDFPREAEVTNGAFNGEAGKILRKVLSESGFSLERIYYTHACQCVSPESKDPTATAIKSCHVRLMAELSQVNPQIIVPMGNAAVTSILGKGAGITKRRGIYQEIALPGNDTPTAVVPMIHPASILKTPEKFPDLCEDVDLVASILNGKVPVIEPPYDNYITVDSQDMFLEVMTKLEELKQEDRIVVVDIETTGLNFLDGKILTIGFSWARETSVVINWDVFIADNLDNLRAIQDAMSGLKVSLHHGQFDYLWLTQRGVWPDYVFDTMLAHYLLDERQGYHGLKRLATARYKAPQYDDGVLHLTRDVKTQEQFLEEDEIDTALTIEEWSDPDKCEQVMKYNGADCDYQYRLTEDLPKEMSPKLMSVHNEILIPAAKHFVELERQGMLVDVPYLTGMDKIWTAEIEELDAKLRSYPGAEDLNFRSPDQVSNYLFKTLGLRQMGGGRLPNISMDMLLEEISEIEDPEAQEYWKTQSSKATGKMKSDSTSTYMLYWLSQQHEFPRLMVQRRIVGKKKDSYCDGIRNAMWADCRVRPKYNIHGTRTGRLSSGNPNIHGTPKLKEIKDIYMADPGFVIISADYSQAEVRMLAHFANDKKLIAALHEKDIHGNIMKTLFKLTDEDVANLPHGRKEFLRRAAKTITFGIIYGRSPQGLAPQIGTSVEEAKAYISTFLEMMPEVKRYIQVCQANVMRDHYVETLYGNRRRFDLILTGSKANEVKRQAVNMPIQGSVSHMTLKANLRVMDRLKREGIKAYPWPHKHDEIMLQVPSHLITPCVQIVAEEMSNPGFDTDVPFISEIAVGRKWGSLEEVYKG